MQKPTTQRHDQGDTKRGSVQKEGGVRNPKAQSASERIGRERERGRRESRDEISDSQDATDGLTKRLTEGKLQVRTGDCRITSRRMTFNNPDDRGLMGLMEMTATGGEDKNLTRRKRATPMVIEEVTRVFSMEEKEEKEKGGKKRGRSQGRKRERNPGAANSGTVASRVSAGK